MLQVDFWKERFEVIPTGLFQTYLFELCGYLEVSSIVILFCYIALAVGKTNIIFWGTHLLMDGLKIAICSDTTLKQPPIAEVRISADTLETD